MDRRSVLAAAVALFAGCGQSPSPDTSTPTAGTGTATQAPSSTATPTEEPTATATEEPTATATETEEPTETPTETETPELSEREERAAQELDRAISDLSQAVAAYTGNASDSLVTVSAASQGFSRAAVLTELTDADDNIENARRLVSGRQQPRLAAVESARRFLRLSIDVQPRLIAAFGATETARDAVVEQQESTLETATQDLREERDDAEEPLDRIESETDASGVSVVPEISESEYGAKVAQFGTEVDGFGSLADFFDRFLTAVADLNDAERFDRAEREPRAREDGQAAADAFDALASDLQAFVDGLSEAGASLEELAADLARIAAEKADDAREIVEDNS
ncbi:hypothetical protein C2R22_08500 [Salinigranum rubrum]|uniref:Uncharacterized protein n=1 Tax=Salinigranum rubrum TaxID=755307 RepID=A0A2I8VID3_9EURY|nr:hypothetical protein [Salinigranum rubrum]AUV81688.1 hypothetical protein C2R22_08500 [Salinigranum rubrum]